MDTPSPRFAKFVIWGDPYAKPAARATLRPIGSKCAVCGRPPVRADVYLGSTKRSKDAPDKLTHREQVKRVRDAFRASYPDGFEPLEGPLRMVAYVYFPCREGDKRVRTAAPAQWHTARPDATNLAKHLEDCLQGRGTQEALAFSDDSAICDARTVKLRAAQGVGAHTVVVLQELTSADLDVVLDLGPEGLAEQMNDEAQAQLAFLSGEG